MKPNESPKSNNKVNISVNLRLVVIILLLVIAGMLAAWKPWANPVTNDRTVSVTGEAKISAEPDEYTFQPSYEFKDVNKETALTALTKKSDEITKKLKDLGVADSKVKINSDGYNYYNYYFDPDARQYTYTLRPTIKINDRAMAQKVQDYLVTTTPSGQVSPQTGFSETKQKELESKARDLATKDARQKADQSARNLGFKVNKVKSIEDGTNFGSIMPYAMSATLDSGIDEKQASSLAVQPGENDLNYTVTVVYYIR